MAEESQSVAEVGKFSRKRKMGHKKKGGSAKKKQKNVPFKKKVKIDKRMKKLYEKRARDYNSDGDDVEDDDNEDDAEATPRYGARHTSHVPYKKTLTSHVPYKNTLASHDDKDEFDGESSDDGGEAGREENEYSEDEDGEIQPGITKFADGCKAFRMAFKKILKKTASEDILGPVLSAHKKLVAEKLAEEDVEKKVKGENKKEKHLLGEKGHVKPANYLDSLEKFLISVATKGVVKLFNAVNKAQHAQKGLNPSRFKDEKTIKKRRKQVFFSELGKTSSQSADGKVGKDGEGPSWAPLRDNYMLTNHKLKDWDKQQETTVGDDYKMPSDADSSSDDE